jgi:RND family efflux transporter MFP subunit
LKKSIRILLPAAVIAGSALIAGLIVLSRPDVETALPETPARLVRALRGHPRTLRVRVRSQGTVVPRTESSLVAQVGGEVIATSPAFVSGGFFDRGDVLVTIDPRDYEFAVSQARARVAQAEVQLRLEEQEARLAREEWARLNEGEPPPLVAREPQLARARADLEAARSSLRQSELNLERTKIRAPYAGRVRAKNVDVGQFVGPGTPVGRIYAVDYAEVRLPLPDHDLAALGIPFGFDGPRPGTPGPEVVLKAEFGGREATWSGRIDRIEGEIDPRSRMIHAVARVEDPYGLRDGAPARPPLAVGLFVEAEILGKELQGAFAVPRAALGDDGRLRVIDPEMRLRAREVEIARIEGDTAVVVSGLDDGELVCLSRTGPAMDGMPVRVEEARGSGEPTGRGGAGTPTTPRGIEEAGRAPEPGPGPEASR